MRGVGRAERTISERHTTMWHFFEYTGTDADTFTERHVIRYLGRRELKPASRATYYTVIRAFCKWAKSAGVREDNPVVDLPAPKRPRCAPRPISEQDFIALLPHVSRKPTRVKILLAALAGLRVHEIAKVRGEDLDMGACTLRVQGKGGGTAVLPLHPALMEQAETMPRRGYWFPSTHTRSGHVTGKSVSKVIGEAMGRAGVEATAHQLRHWYGSSLLVAGADLRTVQELMRHESIQSTQIYTMVSDERRADAIARLELPAAA